MMRLISILILSCLLAADVSAQFIQPFRALLHTDCAVTDPDACSYIKRVEAVPGGRMLAMWEKNALNDWFVGMKADGNYTTAVTDGFFPFWGNAAQNLISIKGVVTFSLHGSPTITSSGIDPDGSTSLIKTNFIFANNASYQNDFHIAYYCGENVPGGVKEVYGAESSPGVNKISDVPKNNSGVRRAMSLTAAYFGATANADTRGFYCLTRTAADASAAYKGNAAQGTSTAASTGLPTAALVFAGTWTGGQTNPSPTFDGECRGAQLGRGVTSTQWYAMNGRWETLLDAFGIGVQ